MSQQVSCLGSLVPAQNPRKKSNGRVSAQPQNQRTERNTNMKKTTTTGGGCIRSVPTYKSAGVIAKVGLVRKVKQIWTELP